MVHTKTNLPYLVFSAEKADLPSAYDLLRREVCYAGAATGSVKAKLTQKAFATSMTII